MPDPVRILVILFVALLGAFFVAPQLEKRFEKKAILKSGLVVVIALALAALGMTIILSVVGSGSE